MIIQIKDNQGKILTNMSIGARNEIAYIGSFNLEFKAFVDSLVDKGVTRLIDVPDEKTNSLTITEQAIQQADPNFPIALKEFLKRSGYEVTEKHPEVEKEIANLLAEFPDDNPDKQDILKRLPEMSYLEQSIILEGLLTLNNPNNKLE